MNTLMNDIRFGIRMLWKHKMASLVCAIALGLGIGSTAAMFSMAEAFLLHPVPLKDASRVVALSDFRPDESAFMIPVSPATYLDWRAQASSFEKLGASDWNDINLTGDGPPQRVTGFNVSANFFELLGVQPAMGRGFLPQEEQLGGHREIILSHGLWERRYGSDPAILGKIAKVNDESYTIVGVMGKGFNYPMTAEAWTPLAFTDKERANRESRYVSVLGRLQPHVSFSQAKAEMMTLRERQAGEFPDAYKGWKLSVMPLTEFASGNLTRQYTIMLLGAVGFVLLIACADVANVQFARVTGRQKELAVRTAMGASRSRIVRQLLLESVLLSLAGAALGLLLARWQIALLLRNMPPDVAKFIAGWNTISLDLGAFCFVLAIAVASGILSGIAPALFVSRTNVSETLKESGRGASSGRVRHRLRSALVVGEITLSLVLLVGAGLLVKGFHALLTVNDKSQPATLLTMGYRLPDVKYQKNEARISFNDRILERLSALPHVQAAALVTSVPYSNFGGGDTHPFSIAGRPAAERGEKPAALLQTVSPNYFAVMNIALREGRGFTESDRASSLPVAVISKTLALRYFPGENPLGHKIKAGAAESNAAWLTIAGVVDDVHYNWINKEFLPTLYILCSQTPELYSSIVLKTDGQPLNLVSAARREFSAIDADLPLFNVKSLDQVITESIIGFAYVAALMGIIGIIALVLATVGVYGVMSYSVSERTHEIGIRVAMGATTGQILRLIIGNGMFLTILGILIGMPIAIALATSLSSLFFGVSSKDPISFVVLPLTLAAVALLASYIPARRALRVDPLVALRYE
jgi:putative ABC transport system permease protein